MKYNHLNVPNHWKSYWTRFPEGHTILEALIQWVSQVDEMVDNQNTLNTTVETYGTRLDDFLDLFDTNLRNTAEETLKDWQTSGFLNYIINEALQWQLDNYITTNEQDKVSLTTQLAQKASKDELNALGQIELNGTYDTLTALQTALPSGATGLYLVIVDGYTYRWDSSNWVRVKQFQTPTDFIIPNLIPNADFSNGMAEWVAYETTTTISNGEVTITATTDAHKNINPTNDRKTGHIYYGRITLTRSVGSGTIALQLAGNTITLDAPIGETKTFSYTQKAQSAGTVGLRVQMVSALTGDEIKIKEPMLLDLTEIFGAGNEPPHDEIEEFLNDLGWWFDGELKVSPKKWAFHVREKLKERDNKIATLETELTNIDKTKHDLYATKSGPAHKVKFRYNDTENKVIEWNLLGVNQIMHMRYFYKETASELTDDFNTPVLEYTISTDWVSPYAGVIAESGTTEFTGTVGGIHGTANVISGFPTAKHVETKLYADGVEVLDGEVKGCNVAKVVVKNMVSASNHVDTTTGAKADSLEELIVYTVTPNNVEVAVYLTSSEDLSINGYVGLQMLTNMFDGKVYFNDSNIVYTKDGVKRVSSGFPFDDDRMVFGNDNHVYVVYTNRKVGIGDLSAKGSAEIFQKSALDKLYAHLVTSPVYVQANKSIYYSGGYTFMPPMECAGAEKAYFILYNGVKEYCVDFKTPVSDTYFKLGLEHIGKEIEIVEKSESITCDDLISAKGLKISASNFGTLKFRIKA